MPAAKRALRNSPAALGAGADVERALEDALAGRAGGVRQYLQAWSHLTAHFVSVWPDPTRTAPPVQTPPGSAEQLFEDLLREAALFAPFSVSLDELGPRAGLVLAAASAVRGGLAQPWPGSLDGQTGLPPDESGVRAARRFIFRVRRELLNDQDPLERLAEAFTLSSTDLGRLFGVTRQAVSRWRDGEVPASHQAKLATLHALVDVLERNLKPGGFPAWPGRPPRSTPDGRCSR